MPDGFFCAVDYVGLVTAETMLTPGKNGHPSKVGGKMAVLSLCSKKRMLYFTI